ncbi:MAG: NAD(P)-dependent oxidoreductase [Deltaproteobacteria bacterium]|nr:NAD(P)-dependent oxidoreductase [Deltaproteobacteria bacterium]MCW9049866.1 NAD(P)-dependent oxidoreductase [Deltaproteobacteria bacterium]
MTEDQMKKSIVGVVGLGSMGLGLALALVDAGFDVVGCDVNTAAVEKLTAAGGRTVESPAAVASEANLVLIVVVNSQQVDQVIFDENGLAKTLAPGGLIIQCATVAPSYVRTLGEKLTAAGFGLLDAPISGGAVKARQGELSVMASGSKDCFTQADEVLNAVAAKVYELGDKPGIGSSMKLVNQLLAGVHIAAAAEAMALGISMDLDPDAIYDVITHSAGNSWMFENRVPHILKGDYTPHSAVDIFVKDLGIVHSTGRELPLSMPIASTALQQFTAASSAGHGLEDDSAVIKVYQHLAGLKLPASESD